MYWSAREMGQEQVDLWGILLHNTVPVLMPLYFIRNLIILDLFTPLFYFLLRSRNNRVTPCAIITMVVLAILYFTQTSFLIPGFTAEAFFFFGGGAFLSLNRFELSEAFYSKRWMIAVMALCLFLGELYFGFLKTNEGKIIFPFFTFFELMMVVNLARWVVKKSRSSRRWTAFKNEMIKWQDASFMLFAFHYFILHQVIRLLNRVGDALTGYADVGMMEMSNQYPCIALTNFLLRVVIMVTVCMILYVLMHRYLPRLNKLLCGR